MSHCTGKPDTLVVAWKDGCGLQLQIIISAMNSFFQNVKDTRVTGRGILNRRDTVIRNMDRIWQERSSNTIFSQQSGRGDARITPERARYVELHGRLVKWDPEPVRGRVSLTGFSWINVVQFARAAKQFINNHLECDSISPF